MLNGKKPYFCLAGPTIRNDHCASDAPRPSTVVTAHVSQIKAFGCSTHGLLP